MQQRLTNAKDAVFPPAIGARTSLVVRKIIPSFSVRTIIFSYRSPSAIAQIRTLPAPMSLMSDRFLQSLFLLGHSYRHSQSIDRQRSRNVSFNKKNHFFYNFRKTEPNNANSLIFQRSQKLLILASGN